MMYNRRYPFFPIRFKVGIPQEQGEVGCNVDCWRAFSDYCIGVEFP